MPSHRSPAAALAGACAAAVRRANAGSVGLLAALLGLLGLASAALAHPMVESTSPEHGAVLEQGPSSIDLEFRGGIRLTRVTLEAAGEETFDLDLSGHEGFLDSYSLPNQSEARGLHTVEWRGLGTDGHVMQGSFSFKVE